MKQAFASKVNYDGMPSVTVLILQDQKTKLTPKVDIFTELESFYVCDYLHIPLFEKNKIYILKCINVN